MSSRIRWRSIWTGALTDMRPGYLRPCLQGGVKHPADCAGWVRGPPVPLLPWGFARARRRLPRHLLLGRDECGVFGIVAPEQEVARLAYFALYALQHRGQESAGIAASQNGHIMAMRDQGLVNQVFDEQKLRALQGEMAVGHVRYSTTGANSWENTQPVWRADRREVALAHNGNLVNAVELHAEL